MFSGTVVVIRKKIMIRGPIVRQLYWNETETNKKLDEFHGFSPTAMFVFLRCQFITFAKYSFRDFWELISGYGHYLGS